MSWTTGKTELKDGQTLHEVMEDVVLEVPNGETLGISITGGVTEPGSDDQYVVINKVVAGGLASRDGRLQVGQKVHAINGVHLVNINHEGAVAVIKQAVKSRVVSLRVSSKVAEKQVTKEQEFAGRHGGVSLMEESGWRVGTLGQATEDGLATIELPRSPQGLGFEIVGPHNVDSNSNEKMLGVYVAAVHAGSVAARDGRIKRGDQIIEINGWQVVKATLKEASTLLRVPHIDTIHITTRANPQGFMQYADDTFAKYYSPLTRPGSAVTAAEKRMVVLQRDAANPSLGMSVAGPGSTDDTLRARGIFVTSIAEGSLAAKDGSLQVGDQILEIDGKCLQLASHDTAADALRASKGAVRLLVVYNPDGYSYYLQEAEKIDQQISRTMTSMMLRRVTAVLDANSLGFELAGAESADAVSDGVFVVRITKQDLKDAGLFVGDQVVSVNGNKVLAASLQNVLSLIRQQSMSNAEVTLEVTTNLSGFEKYRRRLERTVVLRRGLLGFGFGLCGKESAADPNGIFISHVEKNSIAAGEGQLQAGEQVRDNENGEL